MSATILFIDDEPNILEGYQRQLRKLFTMETAASGAQALEMLSKSGPYAVIITDMQMPGMNGIELLKQASIIAPNSVRMMLTGNADQQTAAAALNEGRIFRFLTKPCTPETLTAALRAGLAQYKLVTAEKELLEKTLIGSISILVDVLSISDPHTFARGKKLRDCAREVAGPLGYANRWELEIAALLSQIGSLTIPPEILLKERAHIALSPQEQELLARVPESGCNLLAKIPRLETAAQIIRYQHAPYENPAGALEPMAGENLPVGSRLLKILSDLLDLEADSTPRSVAFRILHSRAGWYDSAMLQALNAYYLPSLPSMNVRAAAPDERKVGRRNSSSSKTIASKGQTGQEIVEIPFAELIIGDVLAADVTATDGQLLLRSGSSITEVVIEKLTNYARYKGIHDPIFVVAETEDTTLTKQTI